MVAHAVRTQASARGARPFDPTRDLTGVARLLEEAFRSEHTFPLSDAPILREFGIALWTMSYAPVFPENVSGFVWLEDGRIVGNVTLSPDEGRFDRFLISNVAVKPSYRRQGIARALMEMAIDHIRGRGAQWVLLNVRPQNFGAIKLYRDLGFQEIEMRGDWSLSLPLSPYRDIPAPDLRPLRASDQSAVAELIRAATPEQVQQFRTPRWTEFGPTWEDRVTESISDFFIGQFTRRWVAERDGSMAAVLMVRGQRLITPHRITVHVHPAARGQFENSLVTYALHELSRIPKRDVRAGSTSTHPELTRALEQHGFQFLNGLTLMALAL